MPLRACRRSSSPVTHGDLWPLSLIASSCFVRRCPHILVAAAVRRGCTSNRTCGSSYGGAPTMNSTRSAPESLLVGDRCRTISCGSVGVCSFVVVEASMNRWVRALLGLLLALLVAPLPAKAASAAPQPARTHQVTFDGYSFMVDGKRTYLWSGEFHYFRLPEPRPLARHLPEDEGGRLQRHVAVLRLGLPLAGPRRLRLHRRARRRQAARHGRSRPACT